ncbi:MAG: ISKra4 family transposase [Sporichthyaceae bacterium]
MQGPGRASRAAPLHPGRGDGRGKRGLESRGRDAETLNLLAERVGELAAAEARRLVHTAAALMAGGEGEGANGVLEAIERAAQHTAASVGLAAVAGVLDWAGGQAPARTPCPDAGHPARLVARRTKTVRTLLGAVETTRGYYHCADCKRGFAPLDDRLGTTGTGLSPGLARACALAGAEMPYDTSRRFIATVTGLDLASTSTLARTTRAHGSRARDLIAAEHAAATAAPAPVPAASTGGPDLCYVVLDGTGAPMLPGECTGRAGKDPDRHPDGRAGTREVKIGALFTQTHRDPDTGDPIQDPASATYVSTFEPAATFGAQVKAEYRRRGFERIRQPVVLGDGARWIWNIAEEHFPAATQIVDYYHAREHLAELAKILGPALTARSIDPAAFERDLVDQLDLGATAAIAEAVQRLDLPHHAPNLVQPAATEVGYFTGNRHRMQYADFRANGYYIGSGHVEAACNTIVKQRAKRAGMHWTIRGLDPVLALRTLHQSGRDQLLWPTPQT